MKLLISKTSRIMLIIFTIIILTSNFITPTVSLNIPSDLTIFKKFGIADRIRLDPDTITLASQDYGNITKVLPAAVFCPTSNNDVVSLLTLANYGGSVRFDVAARGQGHSVNGQATAANGVVLNMTCLSDHRNGTGIIVNEGLYYADVGAEQIWIDVLKYSLSFGFSPVSWTDYLYLSVGGTLSNAGIGGQSFRFGPQISNVYELDVITGKGEVMTCSKTKNPNLFNGVLGGLGQFGVITRARIRLEKAPTMVKWARMLYSSFSDFTRDQERLITLGENASRVDYLEGQLLWVNGFIDTSFFPPSDESRIVSLVKEHKIIYVLELATNYNDTTRSTVEQEFQLLLDGLSFISGFNHTKDVAYLDFLNRVREDELKLRSLGLWEVPHPWLNLFIPKSQIFDFNEKVLKEIVLKQNNTIGLTLMYPMNRNKWDDDMSAVTPNEDVFYTVGFLHSSGYDNLQDYEDLNKKIIKVCDDAGIKIKLYLHGYTKKEDWINHFGSKWNTFRERKFTFDPKKVLSPGQMIFNN